MYKPHALRSGRYVYDVLQTDASGDKKRLMEGQLIVTPSVKELINDVNYKSKVAILLTNKSNK